MAAFRDKRGLHRRQVLQYAFAAAASAALPAPVIAASTDAKIARMADTFLSAHPHAALSFALGRKGEIVYQGAFGPARYGSGDVATTTEHRFRIASVTKPVTASTIMLLVDQGKLSLDDTVFGEGGVLNATFPLTGDEPHVDWLQAITIDHLLTHTCGGWTNDSDDPMFAPTDVDQTSLIQTTLAEAPLSNEPGKKYAYSNFGYCLLGRVIEKVTGGSYDGFVRTTMLTPAGISGMRIGGSQRDQIGDDEVTYLQGNGAPPYGMNIERMDSHGGWIATPTEMVKFAMTVDGDPAMPDTISAASVDVMRRPSRAYAKYGHGWAIGPKNPNRWHDGSLPGTSTLLVVTPGGVAFAGFTNCRDGQSAKDIGTLAWGIHDALV